MHMGWALSPVPASVLVWAALAATWGKAWDWVSGWQSGWGSGWGSGLRYVVGHRLRTNSPTANRRIYHRRCYGY